MRPTQCGKCRTNLDALLALSGETTHPTCDPDGTTAPHLIRPDIGRVYTWRDGPDGLDCVSRPIT